MRANGPGQSTLLLLDVIDILEEFHIAYAVIGAFAASFYGVIRASMDADAVISLNTNAENRDTFIHRLQERGFKVTFRKGDSRDPIEAVINISDEFHNRVDLLMGIQGITDEVFSRAVSSSFMGKTVCIIGIEDFIAGKIFAGSPKDISDIQGVLEVSKEKIDLPLLKDLVLRYGKKALEKLETLL